MKRHALLLAMLFTTHMAHADDIEAPMQALREDAQEGAATLYQALAKDGPDNFVMSPHAIETAAAMLYAGAAGATAEQLARAMHWRLPPELLPRAHHLLELQLSKVLDGDNADPNVALINAAHLWVKEGTHILEGYQGVLRTHFDAGVETSPMGPGAADVMNKWVGDHTHGVLHDLVTPDSLSPPPALVEIAATYFKAPWAEPCSVSPPQIFFSRLNTSKRVPMVKRGHQKALPFAETSAYVALELPYKHDTLSMLVIMPKGPFDLFERKFGAVALASIASDLHDEHVEVIFPRFEITTPFPLKTALVRLGVHDLFVERADLRGISKDPLHVDTMLEQARIKVDEHGTEAAAAVATTVRTLALMLPPRKVVVDHPFIFVIHNKALGVPLFMGRVTAL